MMERNLLGADLRGIPQLSARVLVVGSGVAGCVAALAAARHGPVLLVTKDRFEESATCYAQGGVAVALAPGDTPGQHLADTLAAGAGLCDEPAVRVLVEEGVDRCRELIDAGLAFDREDGKLAFTREAAHRQSRVLHAAGDATGRVMIEALRKRVRAEAAVHVLEDHFAVDLLAADGQVHGALVLDARYGRLLHVRADATVLATGGLGQVFRETTNPAVATGDGFALAFRAGAVLRDMEFVQFHPTTLYLAGAPRFLVSEAVRGEGAYLRNLAGERFMFRHDPAGELAPRDVVSRSIFQELNASGATHVCLDLRHLDPALVARRFPSIRKVCADFGLDLAKDAIPVRPAAHYMMGGVATDLLGRTAVRRLYAAGEVASTGVHGANRLASNSLLEGMVFGHRAGTAASAESRGADYPWTAVPRRLEGRGVPLDLDDLSRSLKALAWRSLGVFRDGPALAEMERTIDQWSAYVMAEQFSMRRGFEIQNLITVARVMARSALAREESRGAHQRRDFPDPDPKRARHSELTLADFSDPGP